MNDDDVTCRFHEGDMTNAGGLEFMRETKGDSLKIFPQHILNLSTQEHSGKEVTCSTMWWGTLCTSTWSLFGIPKLRPFFLSFLYYNLWRINSVGRQIENSQWNAMLQLHQKLNMLGLEALGSCNATPSVAISNTMAQRLFNLNICSLNLGTFSTLQ
jgi:hypothetical protein